MKPFVEKLHLDDNTSFYVRTHRTPQFEVPWHQHEELELILFKEGYGTAYIGNHVGDFNEGDVFLLGSNLPHTFQKNKPGLVVSAVVIQFEKEFWGTEFLSLPETKVLGVLFAKALLGIQIRGKTRTLLNGLIRDMEDLPGLARIIRLTECLRSIAAGEEYDTVSTQEVKVVTTRSQERIDKVYQYTIDHFSDPIGLEQVAALASMSVPAFCNYFKKRTKKTYIEFLNEVRIGHACKLLMDTTMSVNGICYACGFNTLANFNKQFLKVKKLTPSGYRKQIRERLRA